jgi:hypothetical protein
LRQLPQHNSTTAQQHNKINWLAKLRLVMFLLTTSSALLFTSCQKDLTNQPVYQSNAALKIPDNFFKETTLPGIVLNNGNNAVQTINPNGNNKGNWPVDPNNGDEEVILSNQLPNPYTVSNMQQAYNILYGPGQTLAANYKYVRFKPANTDELVILQETEDLELQDYPMDYAITQDGDYYQDPNLGIEDISWLYSVVPIDYTPPVGIQYEILSALYIPDDNLLLEGMAESLVDSTYSAAATYSVTIENGVRVITRTDIEGIEPMYPPPCEDPGLCGGGGGGGGNPPPLPPGIYVEDQRACGTTNTNTTVPLRIARVVCKRWFKIWRGYTNDLGRYNVTKTYRNNVKVIVKTKNNLAKVSKVRGIRLWQMDFPVKKRIGIFPGNQVSTLRYVFWKPVNASANNAELPYWAAATTHNGVVEFWQYSAENALPNPPNNLKIILTNWNMAAGSGSTVMFNKCHDNTVSQYLINFFIANSNIIPFSMGTMIAVLKNNIDMTISYLPVNADYNCRLTSANLKEIVFHELGHAQHYNQVGCNFWTALRAAEITELINSGGSDPYGNGNNASTAPIIATAEMWGNHTGYTYTNRHYGNGGTAVADFRAFMQNIPYQNIAGLNCYLNAIENHNPNNAADVYRWIPQGLLHDLLDATVETFPVIDNVSGYSAQQCFTALQSDVRSIPAFRDRLLQLNGNNQQVQVTDLFFRYDY